MAARSTLEKSGEQWTVMRAQIFEALAGFDKPASAYDIAEAVSKAAGRRVAANEAAARAAGFKRAGLMATLAGEPLYRACGYSEIERVSASPVDGIAVPLVRMGKALA